MEAAAARLDRRDRGGEEGEGERLTGTSLALTGEVATTRLRAAEVENERSGDGVAPA